MDEKVDSEALKEKTGKVIRMLSKMIAHEEDPTVPLEDFDPKEIMYTDQQKRRYDNIMEMVGLLDGDDHKRLQNLIRFALHDVGTDVKLNDSDPQGNGDQSIIESYEDSTHAAEIHRATKQAHARFYKGADSKFGNACIEGNLRFVQESIQSVCTRLDRPYSRQHDLKVLLETRETGLRLSPLLMVVAMTPLLFASKGEDHLHPLTKARLPLVAKLLLRAGASPDCKDALGKTAVHYGAGPLGTELSMTMADMCICASKTSDLYGKDVVLEGLQTVEMNGKRGVVGGYDYDKDRRAVYVDELKKEIWVKPENIKLADGMKREDKTSLVDVKDRLGNVPLRILISGFDQMDIDCEDVARFLLHKHHASIHIKQDGTSLVDYSISWRAQHDEGGKASVAGLIAAVARHDAKEIREAKKEAGNVCGNCCKSLGEGGQKCANCKVTFYCSRTCQAQHWKEGHREECKELVALAAGVVLSSEHLETILYKRDKYRKPESVIAGEKFVVSVIKSGESSKFTMADQSGTCHFTYKESGPGFATIVKVVEEEPAWEGQKTFMKASFDEEGECTLYPATAVVKNKYKW